MRQTFFCLIVSMILIALPAQAQEDDLTPYEIALQRIEELKDKGADRFDSRGWVLNLNHMGLTELPPEIGELTQLVELWLNDNQLKSLPPEIGDIENLRVLSVNGNQLTSLPSEIGNLKFLCYLDVQNNRLRHLPHELSQVEGFTIYQYCPFTPPFQHIYLKGNPLITPPPEIIEQGTPAILAYLRNQAWWHVRKMMISAATSVGVLAAVFLGLRIRYRRVRRKKKVDSL